MIKTYKVRIYPNKEQETLIQKTFGCVRYVYNYFLDLRIKEYQNNHKVLYFYDMSKFLTQLKKEKEWLKEPDKWALQNALKNLDFAYKMFCLKHNGFPKFKSKKNNYKSYKTTCSNNNIEIKNSKIKLPKLGYVKFRDKYDIKGKILNVSIVQVRSGKYFAFICCNIIEDVTFVKTNKSIGLDLGLTEFCVMSDGIKVENPKYLRKSLDKLARLQRELSRKPIKGSNHNKARIKVAKQYEKITNQRKDFLQKLSTQLIQNYDIICIEDLAIQQMLQNHKVALSLSDVSWGQFISQLEYKANWNNRKIIKIDRFYPSSQTCSVCGYINKDIKNLKIREWECPCCHSYHDRDINAAINILNKGLEIID